MFHATGGADYHEEIRTECGRGIEMSEVDEGEVVEADGDGEVF